MSYVSSEILTRQAQTTLLHRFYFFPLSFYLTSAVKFTTHQVERRSSADAASVVTVKHAFGELSCEIKLKCQ